MKKHFQYCYIEEIFPSQAYQYDAQRLTPCSHCFCRLNRLYFIAVVNMKYVARKSVKKIKRLSKDVCQHVVLPNYATLFLDWVTGREGVFNILKFSSFPTVSFTMNSSWSRLFVMQHEMSDEVYKLRYTNSGIKRVQIMESYLKRCKLSLWELQSWVILPKNKRSHEILSYSAVGFTKSNL